MKKLIFIACFIPIAAFSQFVIPTGVTIATVNEPEIAVSTGGNITINTAFDFSQSRLSIHLIGTNQTLTGNLFANRLQISGGGTKTLNGNLFVSQTLMFESGFIKPSATAKLLFSGGESGLTGASEASFVDGKFFNNGAGFQRYPIGIQGFGFMPLALENGGGAETSVEVVAGNPGLTPASSEVELSQIINSHYWVINTPDIAKLGSRVKVSMNGVPDFGSDLAAVIVEADGIDREAYNIGGTASEGENAIMSFRPASRSVITIGASSEIDILIHDLISPFKVDGFNDFLEIDNIAKFSTNKVTLLDRYGAVVKTWTNFTNYNDPVTPNQDTFTFTKLSAGNYICVVEYGSETQPVRKKSQMVTILKN